MNSAHKFKLIQSLGDHHIGHEARAQVDDHADVKIWLRLLACSSQIEQQIRQRLRTQFGTTLARFDYLAQLDRQSQGLRMNTLSRYLMVTCGNITALTDQLVKEGWVKRVDDVEDRRSYLVMLTEKGRAEFSVMAEQHNQWLADFFHGIETCDKESLYQNLGQLRVHLAKRMALPTSDAAVELVTPRGAKK